MRQIIIVKKDLNMSPGKLAAQVSHASMAFITNKIRRTARYMPTMRRYESKIIFDADVFDEWIDGTFTKTVCEAKNKNQLMKVINMAEDLGLKENIDFFLIKDNCLTELTPEEIDDNGIGRTITCIDFKPLQDDITHKISKKYQLYH